MKQVFKQNIAVFPWSLDYFLAPDLDVYYLVAENRPEDAWTSKFLDNNKIIYYKFLKKQNSLDQQIEGNIFKYSNLAEKLKESNIKFICTTGDINKFSKDWANENDIQFIETKTGWQGKLENKIYFDKFLAKNNLSKPKSLTSKPSDSIFNFFKNNNIVLQQASSCGGEGTFFLQNKEDLNKLIEDKKINIKYNYLFRQKVPGIAYGATLFVAPGVIALSALRRQCFSGREFKGINWLETSFFSQEEQEIINKNFKALGEALYKKKFFGFAGMDFIFGEDGFYFIECNPRLSLSTAQNFAFLELSSGLNIAKLFLENFCNNDFQNNFKFYDLPNISFDGAVLEVNRPAGVVKNIYQAGIYSYINNEIIFKDADIRKIDINNKQDFIYMSLLNKGERYYCQITSGNVLSNFALFDKNGKLNKVGETIEKYFN